MNVITVHQTENVDFSNESLTHKKGFLRSGSYRLHDLSKISILTNDQGPFVDDTGFAFFFINDVLVIPCGHPKYDETYNYITKHFKVDFETVIQAMSSANNQEFVIWKKEYGMSV